MTTNHAMVDPVNVVSFVAPDRSETPKAESSFPAGSAVAFSSMAQLDLALIAAGDTQAKLNTMTLNDKTYRLRTLIQEGTVTSSDFLPAAVIEANTNPDDEVHPFGTVWINEFTPQAFQTPGDGTWVSIWDGS